MVKKIVMSTVAAVVLASAFSTAVFASDASASVAPPIHWAKAPFDNTAGVFKSGKAFCSKKFIGKKTCVPAMNNTADALSFNTTDYSNDNAPIGNVVTLMGTGKLPTAIFTVQDTAADGTVTTVYSGPADNRVGIICNQDATSKAITCTPWK